METSQDAPLVLYDALLREGPQTRGISLSVSDKLTLAQALDELGLAVIEGGWPGANPKDNQFFKEAQKLKWKNASLAAFGMTCRPHQKAEKDPVLNDLLRAGTSIVTIFGKTWDVHVKHVLRISLDENLKIIENSIRYLKKQRRQVIYDAEHFFDGYRASPAYARRCLCAAREAGADVIVLCDTNGGTLPEDIRRAVRDARTWIPGCCLGIHCHNDADLAVANTLVAVSEGVVQIQGCINGYGERCGNANLTSLIPTLALKMKRKFIKPVALKELTRVSHLVDEVCNMHPRENAPYVGISAFSHKAGVHISAVQKLAQSYEHVPPAVVGNLSNQLVSDQAGRALLLDRLKRLGVKVQKNSSLVSDLLNALKEKEGQGYQYEGAEASFEILVQKTLGRHRSAFELIAYRVIVEEKNAAQRLAEATVKLRVMGQEEYTVAEGDGPVNALDAALRKALTKFYPSLRDVHLTDFKVRVLDAKQGTAAKVRVLIESRDSERSWSTLGVSENIIEASWEALVDSIEYKLMKNASLKGKGNKK